MLNITPKTRLHEVRGYLLLRMKPLQEASFLSRGPLSLSSMVFGLKKIVKLGFFDRKDDFIGLMAGLRWQKFNVFSDWLKRSG